MYQLTPKTLGSGAENEELESTRCGHPASCPPEHVPACLPSRDTAGGALDQRLIQHRYADPVDDDELLPVRVGERDPTGAGHRCGGGPHVAGLVDVLAD